MPSHSEIHKLVEQDRFELIMRCPFYGRIICSVELVVVSDPQVRLACTDYSRIFISGDAYSVLPEEMRLAVLAHEILHIALRHAFRVGNRDKNRFEKAADAEVHFILTESFPDPYEIKCQDEWAELTAEQIYNLLPPRESKTKPRSMHCSPNDRQADNEPSDQSGGGNTEADCKQSADGNTEANSNAYSEQTTGSRDKQKKNSAHSNNHGTKQGGHSEGKSGKGGRGNVCNDEQSGGGENKREDVFPEYRPRFDAETEMNCIALSSGTMMDIREMGNGGISSAFSPFERLLKKLEKPRVRWQVLLRQFLRLCRGGGYSWSHPNRRFIASGLCLPGRCGIKSFSGIIALDTSPSTIKALPRFVSELTGSFRAFGKFDLTIIECAARILQVWNISSNEPIPDIKQHKFKGCGGTNFTPVFEYICEHRLTPNVLIYFTDGEGPCPKNKPPYPVLWMLTKDGRIPASWGKVIFYEEN